VKKQTLKKICDYWETEAGRNAAEAARWRRSYEAAQRQLDALRGDPLATFRAEFRAEAMRQIDAWPQGCDGLEHDASPRPGARRDDPPPPDE